MQGSKRTYTLTHSSSHTRMRIITLADTQGEMARVKVSINARVSYDDTPLTGGNYWRVRIKQSGYFTEQNC